jgi:putative ubiquitin-RnfH superfamily antitoxin RatB of RatAB toxin-antitoxin module
VSGTLEIELVYAFPDRQIVRRVEVSEGATVGGALKASGLIGEFPELADWQDFALHGHLAAPDTRLRNHDRIEILRPLSVDPKEIRRLRAKKPGAKR